MLTLQCVLADHTHRGHFKHKRQSAIKLRGHFACILHMVSIALDIRSVRGHYRVQARTSRDESSTSSCSRTLLGVVLPVNLSGTRGAIVSSHKLTRVKRKHNETKQNEAKQTERVRTRPMNSVMTFLWNQGGRNVFSSFIIKGELISSFH